MNANIVLSVKGRKVKFNPHENPFKWEVVLPIERIELKCENSHHFDHVGYVPRGFHKRLYITVICDKWNLSPCDEVVLPVFDDIALTYQIRDTLFKGCNTIISVPLHEIKQYIEWLRR